MPQPLKWPPAGRPCDDSVHKFSMSARDRECFEKFARSIYRDCLPKHWPFSRLVNQAIREALKAREIPPLPFEGPATSKGRSPAGEGENDRKPLRGPPGPGRALRAGRKGRS